MFDPQGSLLEEQEEQINDERRHALILDRQARQKAWQAMEGDTQDDCQLKKAPRRGLNPAVIRWLRARGADRDRRKAAVREFEALADSAGRTVN
jgi:hypothetical protein